MEILVSQPVSYLEYGQDRTAINMIFSSKLEPSRDLIPRGTEKYLLMNLVLSKTVYFLLKFRVGLCWGDGGRDFGCAPGIHAFE